MTAHSALPLLASLNAADTFLMGADGGPLSRALVQTVIDAITASSQLNNLPATIFTASSNNLTTANRGRVVVANRATAITFNLPAVASAGAGFPFLAYNRGAGLLTVDPSGAELINGGATLALPTGTAALLVVENGEWRAFVWWPSMPPSSIGRQSFAVPAGGMIPRATNGAAPARIELATNKVMVDTLNFDAATAEYAQFSVAMPKSWNAGAFRAKFYWSHPTASLAFGVVWGIRALARGDGEALDTAFGTAVTVSDTGGFPDGEYISTTTLDFTPAGSPAGEQDVYFEIYRDATAGADNLAVDARLHKVLITYVTSAATDD